MKFLLILTMMSGLLHANSNDLSHRPKSFATTGGKAVFVDFTQATYTITYDMSKALSTVKAEIKFAAPEAGLPVFDSVAAPTSLLLDGQSVQNSEIQTPSGETTLRILNKQVTVGDHTMVLEVPLSTLVDFRDGNVKSAFWTSDLDSREFMERYMPANLEYDQVKMTFLVKFIGAKAKQLIYTNGVVTNIDSSTVKIEYPSHYNSSSIFFHTVPEGAVDEVRWTIKSIDGRELPAVVYMSKNVFGTSSLGRFKTEIESVIHELESDYGAFPHPSVTVYNAGSGGMEYCGATMTDFSAVGHELFHSYFARGVMPANGNSGWLDEALASWRDGGYQSLTTLLGSSQMSSHPYYNRITDTAAYSFGKRFMAYLDAKLKAKGGLKPFMRHMIDQRIFAPLFVEEFSKEMGDFYGISVAEDFKRYTYGNKKSLMSSDEHPVHRKMSVKELKKFL